MRCGPSGTSWHVTAKSSICVGVGFINLASTQGRMADLVEKAMAVFGALGPPANHEKRLEAIEALPESEKEKWEELDAAFINLSSPEAELRAFVEAHRSEFYAP
jgi:hypothetical protein